MQLLGVALSKAMSTEGIWKNQNRSNYELQLEYQTQSETAMCSFSLFVW
jgi:hypothetical protein